MKVVKLIRRSGAEYNLANMMPASDLQSIFLAFVVCFQPLKCIAKLLAERAEYVELALLIIVLTGLSMN